MLLENKWLYGPYVIILMEKHGNVYYTFNSKEELEIVCIDIVKNRVNNCFYNKNFKDKPIHPGITKEFIETLPESLQKHARKELIKYKWNLKNWTLYNDHKKMAQKALEGNGTTAMRLLEARHNYEYEDFEIEGLITPEKILEKG